LIVYEDDSSRFIVSYGVYPALTSKYSVDVLRKAKATEKYGKPEEILSDHGTTFYAIESDEMDKGLTKFEKLFGVFEKKVKFFNSVDEFMQRYNLISPHGTFDIGRFETPAVIFYQRLPKREVIMDPSLLKNFVVIYVSLQNVN